MDYELSRLGTRSFEQLVQALAAKVIAKGLLVFGDGPDGGREASYTGTVPYPSDTEQWSGTVVLQAKFRQEPVSTKSDTNWALRELKNELQKTFKKDSARIRPTHYVYATNVSLSSVPETGGKALLEAAAKEFPLVDLRIWDYRTLCTHIDDCKDVRDAFLGFICPGDVLAEIRQHIRTEAPDFDKVIANLLEKELLADQYANLEQAGRVADEKIPISRVFIDLPMQPDEASGVEGGFTDEILALSSERLNPGSQISADPLQTVMASGGPAKITGKRLKSASQASAEMVRKAVDSSGPVRGRLVLIGGPGQGKTTVGQFICQLFRTSLLLSRPAHTVTPEAQSALKLITSQCEEDEIRLPNVRRFPLRIPLTELSDRLASDNPPGSLLQFMVDRIRRRVSRELSTETFRAWLGEYPWLLVLDGLDEVPASSNREEILNMIRDFWVDVTNEDSDVLVLATTRPQGYNNDFSPERYRHITLAPLSKEHALRYGRRLAQAQHGDDETKRDKVVKRLEQATRNPATTKLMASPLQVTIIATLVARAGNLPQARWKLFSDYYGVIYMREVEREIPAAEILRRYKPDVDAIHRRVAMVLQVEGEHALHGEARMSSERFATIVRQRLREEGHEGDSLAELEEQIISAAADRLVFLVGLRENEVGFEIRSLQEFMAAEALMYGREQYVTARLRAIAGVTSWRNVFLFAAGQCYAERQHLRDTIYDICRELNDPNHDPLASVVLPGSILAADLLAGRLASEQPAHSNSLGTEALRLLDDPEAEAQLCRAYQPSLEECYRQIVQGPLEGGPERRHRSLSLLMALDEQGVDWAKPMLDANVPQTGDGLLELLDAAKGREAPEWLTARAHASVDDLSMVDTMRYAEDLRKMGGNTALDAVDYLDSERTAREESLYLRGPRGNNFELSVGSTDQAEALGGLDEEIGEDASFDRWPGLAATISFMQAPSSSELARQLHQIADSVPPQEWQTLEELCPWPMSAALADADGDVEHLRILALGAERGALGDAETWARAEQRWKSKGIGRDDLNYAATGDGSVDDSIDRRGFPLRAAGWSINRHAVASATNVLLGLLKGVTNPSSREVLLEWVGHLIRVAEFELPNADGYAQALLAGDFAPVADPDDHSIAGNLRWAERPSEAEMELLERIGMAIGPLSADAAQNDTLPVEEMPESLFQSWNAGGKSAGFYRLVSLGLPVVPEEAEPIEISPPPPKVAQANPGATGLLLLKREDWTETTLDRAMETLSKVARDEPIWLHSAVRVIEERIAEPGAERALKLLWDITCDGGLHRSDGALIGREVKRLGKYTVDRRATKLEEPRVWRELELFEFPPPDQRA